MLKYEHRLDQRGYLTRKKQRRYDNILADEEYYDRRRGYDDGYSRGGYGRGGGRRRRGGPIGLVGGLIGAAVNATSDKSFDGRSREYEDAYDDRLGAYDGRSGMRRSFDERLSNAPAPHAAYGGQNLYHGSAPAPYDGQNHGHYDSNPSEPYGRQAYGQYGSNAPAPYGGQNSYGGPAPTPYGGQTSGQSGSNAPAPYSKGNVGGGAYDRYPRNRRQKNGILGTVKRVMREDVLYLMIVNMPSEDEMAEARETLARAKSGH